MLAAHFCEGPDDPFPRDPPCRDITSEHLLQSGLYLHAWSSLAVEQLSLRYKKIFRTIVLHDIAGMGFSTGRKYSSRAVREGRFAAVYNTTPRRFRQDARHALYLIT